MTFNIVNVGALYAAYALALFSVVAGFGAMGTVIVNESKDRFDEDTLTQINKKWQRWLFRNRRSFRYVNLVVTMAGILLFAQGMYEFTAHTPYTGDTAGTITVCYLALSVIGIPHYAMFEVRYNSWVYGLFRWLNFSGYTGLVLFIFSDFVKKDFMKGAGYTGVLSMWSGVMWLLWTFSEIAWLWKRSLDPLEARVSPRAAASVSA